MLNSQFCDVNVPRDGRLSVSSNILSQLGDVKHTILTCIYENPGIRYREILKLTGISNGLLEYHLKELETSYEIINVDRSKSKTTRYSPSYLPSEESKILGYLRDDTTIRQILLFILKQVICTFNEIVKYTKKSPSTISWHLGRLNQSGIVSIQYNRRYNLYKITNQDLMVRVLYKYRNGLAVLRDTIKV